MIVESTPPERNAPSGTSLCSRISTDEVSSVAQLLGVLARAAAALRAGSRAASSGRTFEPAVAIHGHVAGRQLGDAAEDRPRMRHVLVGQVLVERRGIDLARHARHFQQALQLAGEQQPARLDGDRPAVSCPADRGPGSTAAARASQMARANMPLRCAEELEPFVLVEVDEHLGVAVGAEAVSGAFQPAAAVRGSCRSRR